jgi:hypothetical protein
MEYGSTGTNQYQIRATAGGVINFNANYTISGSAGMHLRTQAGGQITYNGGLTITVSGTPSFTEFCHAELCGVILFNSGTLYSGSATGTRYNVSLNAAVNTNGGGANFFPGNAAGTTATGGQYA